MPRIPAALRLKRADDTPLLARSIRRVRKGVYEIMLYHPSGRKYGYERVFAASMHLAYAACLRLYPTTVFVPKRRVTPKSNQAEK